MTCFGATRGFANKIEIPAEINEKSANKIEELLNGLKDSVFCEAGIGYLKKTIRSFSGKACETGLGAVTAVLACGNVRDFNQSNCAVKAKSLGISDKSTAKNSLLNIISKDPEGNQIKAMCSIVADILPQTQKDCEYIATYHEASIRTNALLAKDADLAKTLEQRVKEQMLEEQKRILAKQIAEKEAIKQYLSNPYGKDLNEVKEDLDKAFCQVPTPQSKLPDRREPLNFGYRPEKSAYDQIVDLYSKAMEEIYRRYYLLITDKDKKDFQRLKDAYGVNHYSGLVAWKKERKCFNFNQN